MANGNPIEWGKLIRDIGLPAVFALMLLLAFLGWVPSPLLSSHVRIEAKLDTHVRTDNTRTYLLRRICQNSATNQEDAYKCLQDSEFSH